MKSPDNRQSPEDPRQSMARAGCNLPAPFYTIAQAFLTWVTGKPLPGQGPLFGLSRRAHLVVVLAVLFGSAVLSAMAVSAGSEWLLVLPFTVGLTLSASRVLWLTDLHAAAHGSHADTRQLNKLIGDIVSLFLFVPGYDDYHESHCLRHHGKSFGNNTDDPDGSFLYSIVGLRPGTPVGALWFRFIAGLLSPLTHIVYFVGRVKANYMRGPIRALATTVYVIAVAVIAQNVGWLEVAIAWLLPLGPLYQVSSIVGWAGEHLWFEPKRGPNWSQMMTHARFFGVPYPSTGSALSKVAWGARMVPHIASRFLVVPGDLPAHDWHHRNPASRQWVHAPFARQAAIANGERYPNETWGLKCAIDRAFAAISQQIPDEFRGGPTAVAPAGPF